MSTFECKVYKLKIEEHPNADTLELAIVGDYRSIVRKGQFKTGDLAVYIPEQSIVPLWALERMGLVGRLAGKETNRVKAVKLRGIVSQGLIFPLEFRTNVVETGTPRGEPLRMSDIWALTIGEGGSGRVVYEGDDVTEWLGVLKYEPPIPTHMSGEVQNLFGKTLSYDIENIKKFPDIFVDGEEVIITEKIHGTWTCFGMHPEVQEPIVTSKGLSAKGLAFKTTVESNKNNLYIRALQLTDDGHGNVLDRLSKLLHSVAAEFIIVNYSGEATPIYILGEIFGRGVQDLSYGSNTPSFRVFDIYVGFPGQGSYMDKWRVLEVCKHLGVETVPVLYQGPYSKEVIADFTSGKETVSGSQINIREGIVINPQIERTDPTLGRVVLKSVSDEYLLRKGEVTEYT